LQKRSAWQFEYVLLTQNDDKLVFNDIFGI